MTLSSTGPGICQWLYFLSLQSAESLTKIEGKKGLNPKDHWTLKTGVKESWGFKESEWKNHENDEGCYNPKNPGMSLGRDWNPQNPTLGEGSKILRGRCFWCQFLWWKICFFRWRSIQVTGIITIVYPIKINIWVFPKIMVPQNGWFIIMENPKTLLKWMIWGLPLFLETSTYINVNLFTYYFFP